MLDELPHDFRPSQQALLHDFHRVLLAILLEKRQRVVERPIRKENQREGAENESALRHVGDRSVAFAGESEEGNVEQTAHRIGLREERVEQQGDVESRFEAAFAGTEKQIEVEYFVDDSRIGRLAKNEPVFGLGVEEARLAVGPIEVVAHRLLDDEQTSTRSQRKKNDGGVLVKNGENVVDVLVEEHDLSELLWNSNRKRTSKATWSR